MSKSQHKKADKSVTKPDTTGAVPDAKCDTLLDTKVDADKIPRIHTGLKYRNSCLSITEEKGKTKFFIKYIFF